MNDIKVSLDILNQKLKDIEKVLSVYDIPTMPKHIIQRDLVVIDIIMRELNEQVHSENKTEKTE